MEACSLAMVYSPVQQWRGLYPIGEALRKGTLFTELDKPFMGRTLSGR
ncbi:MAG: spore coat associated protein CotJA [Ruminococcaceae bacterium]|nr:spore coat associated protein CotJA [Oscillospiraceae bacterium]